MSTLPRITIVTPSMNQGKYLEATIQSVVGQQYPNLEYIVVDGGSGDGSVEIIQRYERNLAWWVSEPDQGQYHAINKGFSRATGEVMAWLNSDDMYLPWTLSVIGEIFATFPDVDWITTMYPLSWDKKGRAVGCRVMPEMDGIGFLRGDAVPSLKWRGRAWIMQEGTFWRRRLWERAGGKLDLAYPLAADLDLWARFFQHAELVRVATPLAGFRNHAEQKTCAQGARYMVDADRVMTAHGCSPLGSSRLFLERRLFPLLSWRGRKLLGWCGGQPRWYRTCRYDTRGEGWCLERVWA